MIRRLSWPYKVEVIQIRSDFSRTVWTQKSDFCKSDLSIVLVGYISDHICDRAT